MPRGARAEPPGRDRGRARLDARGRRRGDRDGHVPGLAVEARGVGPRRAHARDQHEGRRDRAAGPPASDRFVAGSIGPTGFLPASEDPTLGQIRFRELVEVFTEQAGGLLARRRRPDHHRDGAGHPRGQGGRLRRPRGVRERAAGRLPIHASRLAAAERAARCCSAPTSPRCSPRSSALNVDVIGLNCSTGPEDMRDAIRFLGECCSVPVACIPNAGLPLQGPDGETIFPEQPEPLADVAGRVRRALRRRHRRRLLRHDPGPHRRDRASASRGPAGRPASPRRAAPPLAR